MTDRSAPPPRAAETAAARQLTWLATEATEATETTETTETTEAAAADRPDPWAWPRNLGALAGWDGHGPATVGAILRADLQASTRALIGVGYATIEALVRLLAALADALTGERLQLRLVLGHPPLPARHATPPPWPATAAAQLDPAAAAPWLAQGVSLLVSAELLTTLALLRARRLEVRLSDAAPRALHAKIYATDVAVTLGSSNLSDSGWRAQLEVNARFTPADGARFSAAWALAEELWATGHDWTDGLIALLEAQLRVVSWPEALARALGELLDGDWVTALVPDRAGPAPPLWPAQRQGLAQALWVLDQVGSVLLADATGSGKTRLGVELLALLQRRLWQQGRLRTGRALVIAPPAIVPAWQALARLRGVPLQVLSNGQLSQAHEAARQLVRDELRAAQLLALDEAHHYLNRQTQRTLQARAHLADHVVLFTATPLNRQIDDLVALIELLGVDNFDEATLRLVERARQRQRDLTPADLAALQAALQRFTVRRTKRQFNALIDREPAAYQDAQGRPCRYPRQRLRLYDTAEDAADQALADEIRATSQQLRGLLGLARRWPDPETLRQRGQDPAEVARWRLSGAAGLARWHIGQALRSSRAALYEHLCGTEAALRHERLTRPPNKAAHGNVLGLMRRLARQAPPAAHWAGQGLALPAWLTDAAAWRAACRAELRCYLQLARLTRRLSPRREQGKARLLADLLRRHRRVVAFDRHPLTLAALARELAALGLRAPTVWLVTGSTPGRRQRLQAQLAPGAADAPLLALCSDALAEGLNLQGAAALVHLDLPSVIRLAEQRIGRVDRLDSPHAEIEIWWPKDSPAFALRASERRLAERHQLVEQLLGANFELPPTLSLAEALDGAQAGAADDTPVAPETIWADLAARAAREDESWADVFAPLRGLIGTLVPAPLYEQLRRQQARVLATVSVVVTPPADGDTVWALCAVRGQPTRAPRWLLVHADGTILTDLVAIAGELRARLARATDRLPPSAADLAQLAALLPLLVRAERAALSRRKQAALQLLERVVRAEIRRLRRDGGDVERLLVLRDLEQLLTAPPAPETPAPDWDQLAETWLDLLQPAWEALQQARAGRRGPRRLLRLRDLAPVLVAQPPATEDLRVLLAQLRRLPPLDQRLAAVILALPQRDAPGAA